MICHMLYSFCHVPQSFIILLHILLQWVKCHFALSSWCFLLILVFLLFFFPSVLHHRCFLEVEEWGERRLLILFLSSSYFQWSRGEGEERMRRMRRKHQHDEAKWHLIHYSLSFALSFCVIDQPMCNRFRSDFAVALILPLLWFRRCSDFA